MGMILWTGVVAATLLIPAVIAMVVVDGYLKSKGK